MLSMAFDVNKFVSRWRKELVGLAVLVSAVLIFLLWQLGQVTLVQIITGLLVLAGLYWTSRRVLAAEETVRVAEEGHITERFTRAIEQLGQEGEGNMAIRLGGIYALERIAKDSEKDHGPIMEVLTAYVREKAHTPGGGPEDGREEDLEEDPEEYIRLPTTDIQAILTVIGRRETTGNNRRNDPLNLTSTQLAEADLGGANLVGVRLDFADLRGADLRGADLCGADLFRVRLERTDLRGAKNLTEEQVQKAENFRHAFLPDYLAHLEEPLFSFCQK